MVWSDFYNQAWWLDKKMVWSDLRQIQRNDNFLKFW